MASTSEEGKRTKPSAGTTRGLAGYPASRDSGARAASAALPFRRRFVSTLADGGEGIKIQRAVIFSCSGTVVY